MGKIIGVCNQKGGTGKTTTAVNLSAYFASVGQRTLLIDMDPQGNATSGCGVNPKNIKNTVYSLITGQSPAAECVYGTSYPNLFVIPSDMALTGGEIELVNLEDREFRLKNDLESIRKDYDYIFIDAPPSLGLLTVNVLTASDSLIVPVQCEYYALEGVSKLVQTIDVIRDRLNGNLDIEGILLTMADFRTRLSLQVIEEVKGFFKEKAFNTIIPRNIKLAEAPSFGQPINHYDSQCVGAKAYQNLAEELLTKLSQSTVKKEVAKDIVQSSEVKVSVGS
jgi:chromosome partitioning protein